MYELNNEILCYKYTKQYQLASTTSITFSVNGVGGTSESLRNNYGYSSNNVSRHISYIELELDGMDGSFSSQGTVYLLYYPPASQILVGDINVSPFFPQVSGVNPIVLGSIDYGATGTLTSGSLSRMSTSFKFKLSGSGSYLTDTGSFRFASFNGSSITPSSIILSIIYKEYF